MFTMKLLVVFELLVLSLAVYAEEEMFVPIHYKSCSKR